MSMDEHPIVGSLSSHVLHTYDADGNVVGVSSSAPVVRRCTRCYALVLDEDSKNHEFWHFRLSEALPKGVFL